LILARLPDAPEGVKGISLFVASKINVNDDFSLGERNKINVNSFEHKMGIHASPTCVMNYDGAKAWLVGEPHKGLKAMFTMMNEARILVGIQGLGIGEVSYQNALLYAKERLQGRALNGAKYPNKKADPITVHPDVRRMLLTMRSFAEAGRILALWTAMHVDFEQKHPDSEQKKYSEDFVDLMTPIVKGYLTGEGTQVAHIGMQILGGYGYIKEYGMEQFMRDCRITEIYEGTNGVQALDLVGRKMPTATGRLLRAFFHPAQAFIDENKANEKMAEYTKPLYAGLKSLKQASLWLAQKALSNKEEAGAASVDYHRMFSLVVIGYIWAKSAQIAIKALENGSTEKAFYESKIATAKFFLNKILPEHYALLAKITAGAKYLEIPDIEVA
jgi:butyryl-CoA dehydrogenase